jgi:hypothetical protein
MNEVALEESNNVKRRTFLIRHSDITRKNSRGSLAFSCPEDLTKASRIENKKAAVLKRLEHAKEKLKYARKEIHEAVLVALEMKEADDKLADRRIDVIMAQVAIRNAEVAMGQD